MSAINHVSVGELVMENPASAAVFERLGVDYCCGGATPLGQACQTDGRSIKAVIKELNTTNNILFLRAAALQAKLSRSRPKKGGGRNSGSDMAN